MDPSFTRVALARRRTVCLGLALGALGGCAAPRVSPARPALKVHGNLTTLELAPVLLAAQRAGTDRVVLQQGGIPGLFGVGSDLPNLVGSGLCDLATNSETQALRYSVQHPDLRFILTVSEGLYRIVARRSAGIRTVADLRGKRVGTMPRTSSAYFLDRTLRSAGLSEADVKDIPFVAGSSMPLARLTEAMTRGELDAATIWEPEMQKTQEALGADAIELRDPRAYRELFSLFTTEAKLRDPQLRAQIVAFVRGVIETSAAIRRDPRVAWPAVAQATRQDVRIIERAWPHHSYPAALPPDLLDVLVEQDVWVARETGRAPRGRAELARLVDASVLQEALRA